MMEPTILQIKLDPSTAVNNEDKVMALSSIILRTNVTAKSVSLVSVRIKSTTETAKPDFVNESTVS